MHFCQINNNLLYLYVVGTQKLTHKVLSTKILYNTSHRINTQQGTNTPQWETQVVDFFDLLCYNYNYKNYQRKLYCSSGVIFNFLSFSFSLRQIFLLFFLQILFLLPSLPFLQLQSLFLSPQLSCTPSSVSGIFFLLYQFPPLILKF